MVYKINNTEIDFDEYIDWLEAGFVLKMCKKIIEISGCSLKEAKDLYDKVILEENINVNPWALEMQAYCMAEYEEDMDNGILEYRGDKYKYLGNGHHATRTHAVPNPSGWQMSEDIYFRCIDCGYLMNGNPQNDDNCPCGKLYKDSSYGRLGSKLGDEAIAVYRRL